METKIMNFIIKTIPAIVAFTIPGVRNLKSIFYQSIKMRELSMN